jgi:hypothetical protein
LAGASSVWSILALAGINRLLERYSEIVRMYMLPSGEEVKLLLASGSYQNFKLQEISF